MPLPNYLLYHAVTRNEVDQCAWSLLKYLGIYNLNPPPGLNLVIYTNQPAALEAYCVFFDAYELRNPGPLSKGETLRQFCETTKGNVLFFGSDTYPVIPLEPILASIEKGRLYSASVKKGGDEKLLPEMAVLGLNTTCQPYDLSQLAKGESVADFTEQYADVKDFRLLLRKFFSKYGEESIPNLVRLAASIDIRKIREQKHQFDRLPFFKKITRKVAGRGWNIADYVR